MLGTIRRHQKWLWFIIAGLTIISFVIFGPSSANRLNLGRGSGTFGTLNGKTITSDEFDAAQREVFIGYFLNSGQWPDKDTSAKQMGFNAQRETYLRLFFIAKEKEAGIQVDTATVAHMIANILRGGSFDAFVEKYLRPEGLNGGDFEVFLRHELGKEELARVTGLSGRMVTPQEAEMLYRREHQDLQAEVVFFSASNYLAKVTITPGSLEQFYSNHLATYIIPERRQVAYVKFDATNYQAEAQQKLTNLDAMVGAEMQKMGTNLYREAKTPEEAKARLREDIIRQAELSLAHKPAS
ncbi:MAG TPA: SurA N-terminal domain-containing protein, partial [Verrucomicrobiae bacterium]|nr:SurA N-terminal domain-containing protein [Verrucomicrobiae bacterium]